MGQGGAEKIVFELCKDINIDMVVASTGGFYEEKLKKIRKIHYIIPDIASKNPFTILKTYRKLREIIENEKITAIHSHHRMAAFYAQLLKRRFKDIRLLYTAHNSFNNKKRLTNFSLKNTEIIACGESVKNNLLDFYGLPNYMIRVIPNSIRIEKYKTETLESKKGETRIVCIGRLTEQKGFDIFIRALEEVKNAHGYIIGDGELLKNLKTLTKNLHIEDRVSFLGFKENVLGYINSSDFVVLPSRWEGFPLIPIESFACGKTIIASNIPGNIDIVNNKRNGLLFKKDNVEDLASRINLLAKDNILRKKLEKQAKADYSKKFSYNMFIESYMNVYKEVR